MYKEPTVKGRKLGLNNFEQKEEINIQPEQNEETRIQKNKESLGNLWDNFKCSLNHRGARRRRGRERS